jgi:hypothetical protein
MESCIDRQRSDQFEYKDTYVIIHYSYGCPNDPVPLRADIYIAPDFTFRQRTLANIRWRSLNHVMEVSRESAQEIIDKRFTERAQAVRHKSHGHFASTAWALNYLAK